MVWLCMWLLEREKKVKSVERVDGWVLDTYVLGLFGEVGLCAAVMGMIVEGETLGHVGTGR